MHKQTTHFYTEHPVVFEVNLYNKIINVFSLLRIKDLYTFRAILAELQDALHKRHVVYFVPVISVGCIRIVVELVQPADITCKQYTTYRLSCAS
jgi:hypothetical protein